MPQKQTRAGRALEMMEYSNVKADIAKSLIAPGTVTLVSANDLLAIISNKCGNDAAKAFQGMVLNKVAPGDIEESTKKTLIDFCKTRKDMLSKSTLAQLESTK